jgi:hypothetical protein
MLKLFSIISPVAFSIFFMWFIAEFVDRHNESVWDGEIIEYTSDFYQFPLFFMIVWGLISLYCYFKQQKLVIISSIISLIVVVIFLISNIDKF